MHTIRQDAMKGKLRSALYRIEAPGLPFAQYQARFRTHEYLLKEPESDPDELSKARLLATDCIDWALENPLPSAFAPPLAPPFPAPPVPPFTAPLDGLLGIDVAPAGAGLADTDPDPDPDALTASSNGGDDDPGIWFAKLLDSEVRPVRPAAPPVGGGVRCVVSAVGSKCSVNDDAARLVSFSRDRRRRPLFRTLGCGRSEGAPLS